MKLLIFILIALSATEAYGLTALDYYNRGEFEKSRNLLLKQVKADPTKGLDWFNLGNSYFMLKQFKYAEVCFYKVETLNSPLAPAAKLYRAKAVAARGEYDSAIRLLQSLLDGPDLTRAIHEEATKDLLALQQRGSGSPTEEAVHLYQNGHYRKALRILARAEPSENTKLLRALILVKLDREDAAQEILSRLQKSAPPAIQQLAHALSDRIRNTYSKPKWLFAEPAASWDRFFANVGGGGRFLSENLWYVTGGYTARWRNYFNDPDLQVLSHELRANAGREGGAELLLFSPFLSHETWAGKTSLLTNGLTMRLRGGSEGLEFGLEAEWTTDAALDSAQEYLAGTTQHYQAFAGMVVAPVYARAYVNFDRRDIGDRVFTNGDVIPAAYRALGPGFTVLWRVRADWVGELGGSYAVRSYPTPAKPGNQIREDKLFALSARVTKVVSKKLSAYAAASQTKNSSTLGKASVSNENYNESQLLIGVVWDAL